MNKFLEKEPDTEHQVKSPQETVHKRNSHKIHKTRHEKLTTSRFWSLVSKMVALLQPFVRVILVTFFPLSVRTHHNLQKIEVFLNKNFRVRIWRRPLKVGPDLHRAKLLALSDIRNKEQFGLF